MKIIERIREYLWGNQMRICARNGEVKITFTIAPNKCLQVRNNDAILSYEFETKGGSGGGSGSPGDTIIGAGNLNEITVEKAREDLKKYGGTNNIVEGKGIITEYLSDSSKPMNLGGSGSTNIWKITK